MKVAIIGSKGQLGSDLVKVFKKETIIPLAHEDIEVTDYNSCTKLRNLSPEVVINTAAFHKTDACEDEPLKAFNVNAVGSRNVAQICKEIGAVYIYISTDYVFDGTKGKPYTESDPTSPINTYGISKVAGEHCAKFSDKYYIIRVSSLFGVAGASGKGGNFVETMIQKAEKKEEIKVVDDIVMSPTYTRDAALTIKNIVNNKLPFGVYHCSNKGYCSWYEFAKSIFDFLSLEVNLKPIKTDELTQRAKRPKFSALKSEKLEKHGLKMNEWREALREYLKEKKHL
ncbi:MAG: dTDP-4-dehydrorhamnose reductase [Candidatus Jordarchaeaceae archaeon]